MNQILRWGAYITFFGFLLIGIGLIWGPYLYFGIGWIVLAVGIPLSFVGLDMDLKPGKGAPAGAARDRGSETPALTARKAPKAAKVEAEYVCSDCGGDLSADMKVCPHCGAKIED